MLNQFSRTALIIGDEALNNLHNKRVAIFGIGGVGGYVAEGLARAGIGAFDLFDDDKVCLTNINRQIIATIPTIGQYKADVMAKRIHEINPKATIHVHKIFYLPETKDQFDFNENDYVVDAVDTVTAKLTIISEAKRTKTPVISCMGMGNKIDPTKIKITDISKTEMDPLARTMRYEMKKRRLGKLKVAFSTEKPIKPSTSEANSCAFHCVCPPGTERKCTDRRDIPGSISFVPSVAGLMIAGEVVNDFIKNEQEK